MPTLVTVSQPANNEILVSSTYLQGLGSYSRLGASQIEHTSATNSLVGDIFFKFYTCNDSTGSKVYSTLDVSTAIADSTIENRFLTTLFPQYYNDATFVSDIGGAYVDISERLSGVVTPTNPLSATLTMPPDLSNPNYLEFVSMGIGSFFGATFVNGGSNIPNTSSSLFGTRVGQVHLTSTDPLASPTQESLYDNTDSGCWQFSDYNTEGIIVYTNLFDGAFANRGLDVWSQLLCVYPILADIYDADYACIFNTLDASFLKDGLGYFDRQARQTTYFGWAGNYLLSIFNDWGIPVICPIWSISDLSIAVFLSKVPFQQTAMCQGDLMDQSKYWRSVGPLALNNVSSENEKTVRSILPIMWVLECEFGAASNSAANISFLNYVQNTLGYAFGHIYVRQSLLVQPTSEGYNAHIYKYILEEVAALTFTPTTTRSYIEGSPSQGGAGVSWYTKLASQPTLTNVFVDSTSEHGKHYGDAVLNFYPNTTGFRYGRDLNTRIQSELLPNNPAGDRGMDSMGNTSITRLTSWLYTP